MKTLVRCAGSSLAGVTIELALLAMMVSLLHVFYLAASLIAGVVGFAVSFTLNRGWAFGARAGSARVQIVKHALVVVSGIAMGTALMWMLVTHAGLPYPVGWLVGGSIVFFGWTYPMQRWFTFAPALA
jgi:putative flippase GtrA